MRKVASALIGSLLVFATSGCNSGGGDAAPTVDSSKNQTISASKDAQSQTANQSKE